MRKSLPVMAYPEGLVQCAECTVHFAPSKFSGKAKTKFCSTPCRVKHWKRTHETEVVSTGND